MYCISTRSKLASTGGSILNLLVLKNFGNLSYFKTLSQCQQSRPIIYFIKLYKKYFLYIYKCHVHDYLVELFQRRAGSCVEGFDGQQLSLWKQS
jgi:hypothetical protein